MSSTTATGEEVKCNCNRETWANILCGLGIAASILIIICAIVSLIAFENGVPGIILDVYLTLMALVSMAAELRLFRALRGAIFHIVKFIYFITEWKGRGIYYMFIGTLSFNESNALNWVAAIVGVAIGILFIVLDCIYKLPVYMDPQVAKAQMEARLKWEREEAQRTLLDAQKQAADAKAAAASATGAAYAQANANAEQAYGQAYGQGQQAYGQAAAAMPPPTAYAPPAPAAYAPPQQSSDGYAPPKI